MKRAGAGTGAGAATGGASWKAWLPVSAPPLHDTVSRNEFTGVPAGISTEPRPGGLFALRGIHELTYQWNGPLLAQTLSAGNHRVAATSRTPEVFFAHDGTFRAITLQTVERGLKIQAKDGYFTPSQ